MYVHEISRQETHSALIHYRANIGLGNVAVLQEIGYTLVTSPDKYAKECGLIVPDSDVVHRLTGKEGTDPHDDNREQIHCENLNEFVISGVKTLRQLVNEAGESARITTQLSEYEEAVEVRLDSGLIIPANTEVSSFGGYLAVPVEIEAIDSLAHSVQPLQDEQIPGNGFYL